MDTSNRPFVGRGDDVRRLAGRLTQHGGSAGLLLTGEAGVGKSRLALELARAAGRPVVELRANAALHPIPLGALAPLLAHLRIEPLDGVATLAALHRAVTDAPLTLVVDDVPALDPASIAVIEQLTVAGDTPMVLTARDGQPLPAEVERLLDDGALAREVVPPLDAAASRALLELALGGPVDPATVRTLHAESGGNPLFLHELIAGAADAGALRQGRGGWALSHVVPSLRLVELVAARFDGLEPPVRALLELTAAGQPLPVPHLDDVALLELQHAGLVVVEDVIGGAEARLAHPLYDEVLRRLTPPARWAAALRAAAGLLLDGAGDDRHLRGVTLLLAAGGDPDPDEATRAARWAFSLLDHALAVRLARAALRVDPTRFDAALVLAGGLSAMQDPGALAALHAAAEQAVGDEQLALATQRLSLHLAVREEDVPAAIGVAEAALARIADPGWAQFVAADLTKWRLMDGQQVEQLAVADDAGGPAQLNAHLITALVGAMDGRFADCEAAVVKGLPLAAEHASLLPNAADLLLLSRFLAMTGRGALEDARRHVEEQLARVGDRQDEPLGMWSYARAVLDLHTGRAGEAERGASAAIQALAWRDFTGLRPVARAVQATALAQLGRTAQAREVLDSIESASLADQKVALQQAQALAWLLVAEGRRDEAVDLLVARGALGVAAQHVLLGALTAYEAVRLGQADKALPVLQEAAARADPELVQVLAEHARALADRDPSALEQAGVALAAIGLPTAAADALGQAAGITRRTGHSEDARRVLARAAHLRDGLDGAAGTDVRAPVLTPREWEVARRAATRERSREIAAALGVSPRTVDNHLIRIYRKLGLTDRGQLAAALAAIEQGPSVAP